MHYPKIEMIRNEVIRVKLEVAPISTNLHESRFRWFGHVQTAKEIYRCTNEKSEKT